MAKTGKPRPLKFKQFNVDKSLRDAERRGHKEQKLYVKRQNEKRKLASKMRSMKSNPI